MATIAEQGAAVSAASAENLPPDAAQVFADEQRGWRQRDAPETTVKAGSNLEDFELLNVDGEPVSLHAVTDGKPAVIVFYRGGWCPYCNIALRAYQAELLPELERRGIALVAISPQLPDGSLSTAEKAELTFTVLSDPGARLAHKIGVAFTPSDAVLETNRGLGLDLEQVNETADLPMPTVLIVDADRTVRFVDVAPDYTARTEVPVIIEALGDLVGAEAEAAL